MGLCADSVRPQRVTGSARTDSRRAESARNPIASYVNFGDDSALSAFTRTQWMAAFSVYVFLLRPVGGVTCFLPRSVDGSRVSSLCQSAGSRVSSLCQSAGSRVSSLCQSAGSRVSSLCQSAGHVFPPSVSRRGHVFPPSVSRRGHVSAVPRDLSPLSWGGV